MLWEAFQIRLRVGRYAPDGINPAPSVALEPGERKAAA